MIEFIRLPYEGCDWKDVEVLTPAQFKKCCESGPKEFAGRIVPCAIGWAYERRPLSSNGRVVEGYYGLVYDYRVAQSFGGDLSKGWRVIGDWINP